MQQVGEGDRVGPGPGNRADEELQNRVEGYQAVEINDNGVD